MNKHLFFIAALFLIGASKLFAHGMMQDTYPANGAIMMEPTDRVEVSFNGAMRLIDLTLTNSKDNVVDIDFQRPANTGTHFKVALPNLSADEYRVNWKAMAQDGHLMKGQFLFTQK